MSLGKTSKSFVHLFKGGGVWGETPRPYRGAGAKPPPCLLYTSQSPLSPGLCLWGIRPLLLLQPAQGGPDLLVGVAQPLQGRHGPAAVSYTHLWRGRPLPGVWTCAPEQGPWDWGWFPWSRSCLSSAWSFRKRPCPISVSYTHLDVYKRQGKGLVLRDG